MSIRKITISLGISLFVLASCSLFTQRENVIRISGSTSVYELFETRGELIGMKEAYQKANPSDTLAISPTGSSDGIKAAEEKTVDFGMSSRALRPEEQLYLNVKVVALDAIVIIVHPDNPITNLTKEQLISIYSGEIKNWKEVGGYDAPIALINRESGSGTRNAFEEVLKLGGKIADGAEEFSATGAIKAEVAQNRNAIGYISFGSVDSYIKPLSFNGIQADVQTIRDGTYVMQRSLLFVYQNDSLSPAAQRFLKWLDSDEAHKIVEQKKFVPIIE